MAAGANERGADDLACRLAHHAAAARRRAEEERQAGNRDAVTFLLSLALTLERDARLVARASRASVIWRWVLGVVVLVAAVALAMWVWHGAF